MDWLGKMLKLPEAFLAGEAGQGGGVIQVRWRGRGAHVPGAWAPHTRAAAAGARKRHLNLLCVLGRLPENQHSWALRSPSGSGRGPQCCLPLPPWARRMEKCWPLSTSGRLCGTPGACHQPETLQAAAHLIQQKMESGAVLTPFYRQRD